MATIRKAVFPVAGMGTRFLPATKANPKEMLPIVDKPLIQYAVEEALDIGVDQLIFVTSSSKRAIEDHFDSNYELESRLEARGAYRLLALVREILPKGVSCVYLRQANPMGLGHAVLCAKQVIGNEPFAVLLADDLIDGGENQSCLAQMLPVFNQTGGSVIAVQPVPADDVSKYGVVSLAPGTQHGQIDGIIEKPRPEDAPSNLAAVGRYILTPGIFHFLEQLNTGSGGEIQLTDAIARLLKVEPVSAHALAGVRFDCGSKLGYLQATIAYALKHPEVADDFMQYLATLNAEIL